MQLPADCHPPGGSCGQVSESQVPGGLLRLDRGSGASTVPAMHRTTIPLLAAAAGALAGDAMPDLKQRLERLPAAPRLLWPAEGPQRLKSLLAAPETEAALPALHRAILARATAMHGQPPAEREMEGRRLLGTSRTVLMRVTHLAYAWRMTGEAAHAERCRRELAAAAAFSDWNPSHFLDVAEMTAAMAIGLDWLGAAIPAAEREAIIEAIATKGLTPSFAGSHSWIAGDNNWNQVCHAGMVLGALAIHPDPRSRAEQVVRRALANAPKALVSYAPDGAYPEGPLYWSYGTSFSTLMFSAMDSALGSDGGLSASPGFLASGDYMAHVSGPSGFWFNYSDSKLGNRAIDPAQTWINARLARPSPLTGAELPQDSMGRLLPLALCWYGAGTARTATRALSARFDGPTPVAMHRSAWSASAGWIAIKGGSPSTGHAHMDAGQFVIEHGGQRWASDLGMQAYESLESKGVKIWDKSQAGQRWRVYRLGADSHNVLMVDGQQPRVDGTATIVRHRDGASVIDLAPAYRDQLAAAQRGAALLGDGGFLIQDELTALPARAAAVRWAMTTTATPVLADPRRVRLIQQGQELILRVLEPAEVRIELADSIGREAYDEPNPGHRQIRIHLALPAGTATRLAIHLAPAGSPAPALTPLAQW